MGRIDKTSQICDCGKLQIGAYEQPSDFVNADMGDKAGGCLAGGFFEIVGESGATHPSLFGDLPDRR
jgi:hypothetical protein